MVVIKKTGVTMVVIKKTGVTMVVIKKTGVTMVVMVVRVTSSTLHLIKL